MLSALLLSLSGVTISLPEASVALSTEIRISDIATVTGDDPDLVGQVEQLSLGYTPAPGFTRVIGRADMQRAAADIAGLELIFAGRGTTRVTVDTETVDSGRILEEFRSGLTNHFKGRDVELSIVSELTELTVPKPRDTIELVTRGQGIKLDAGQQGIALDVVIDGTAWKTVWSRWQIDMYQELPVLVVPVALGQELNGSMFRTQRIKRSSSTANGVPLPPAIWAHSKAKSDLPIGHVVLTSDVERIVVVRKGDLVNVEVRSGTVTAMARATALADGSVGDRISVSLDATKRELVATVEGHGVLVIQLPKAPSPSRRQPRPLPAPTPSPR